MSAPQPQVSPTENEWTVMVFFAGDPRLSPSMTAQLKALKDAGFQENTTVLVHYDPNEKRVATTTFEINRMRKTHLKEQGAPATIIGDNRDPFVRNLIEDSVGTAAPKLANATEALRSFLRHGLETKAKHYLVFLVGHGVIVGNDFFLPDHHPEETGITLENLGLILHEFQNSANRHGGEVELIGLHSCSMSGIEVAYELSGAAKYLLATEGSSFVTSWPYRQLMKKILNTVDREGNNVAVDDLVKSIQQLSLHNSKDFMFSGLSADVCLCSLDPKRIDGLNGPIQRLSKALKAGLANQRGLELIIMAHLKAQSYFEESYTDLFDFCFCLEQKCDEHDPIQKEMMDACGVVKGKLEESPQNVIVQADFFGPVFQYSHGLSIFFPWSEPLEDDPLIPGDTMLGRYARYEFTRALKDDTQDDSWLSFLDEYFSKTQRHSRQVEEEEVRRKISQNGASSTATRDTAVENGSNGNAKGGEALEPEKPNSTLDKPNSRLEGDGCGCSVKNYPMQFSIVSERAGKHYTEDESAAARAQNRRQRTTARR
jgi:hypothetical protein